VSLYPHHPGAAFHALNHEPLGALHIDAEDVEVSGVDGIEGHGLHVAEIGGVKLPPQHAAVFGVFVRGASLWHVVNP